MPMSVPRLVIGWNTSRVRCRLCGEDLEPGTGPLVKWRNRGVKSFFIVEHPGCVGILPWRLHRDGWVYICTGVGPDGSLIKVGTTAGNPSDRVSEVYHSPGYSPVYISRSTDPRTVMVWGAYDAENRYKAETRVHCALKAYRVSPELKLGREVYAAPLPLVLRVLEQEVSGMVEMFAWNIDPYVFGYPIPKRHTSGGDAT